MESNKKLQSWNKDVDWYIILNSANISNNEDCIIKQEEPQAKKSGDLSIAVLYRCNGNDFKIRKVDKIEISSYYFFKGYKGIEDLL